MTLSISARTACCFLTALFLSTFVGCGRSSISLPDALVLPDGSAISGGGVVSSGGVAGSGGARSSGGITGAAGSAAGGTPSSGGSSGGAVGGAGGGGVGGLGGAPGPGGSLGGRGGVAPYCCASDEDCTSSAPPCVQGGCRGATFYPYCWRDTNCTNSEICSGASLCPCGADCSVVEEWGTCVPAHAGCCASDVDCVNGGECVAGRCKPRPPSGSCWSANDCNGGTCGIPPIICACGNTCLVADATGTCVPWHTP